MNPKVKLGLYEKAIHNCYDWAKKLELAKKAGFSFIEISIDESDEKIARLDWDKVQWLELKQLTVHYNVPIQSMCLSAHRKYALGSSDPLIQKKGLELFQKALDVCVLMDIKCIQLAGYDVYYEPSNQNTVSDFLKNLKTITNLAQSAGVQLAIETMDTPFLGTSSRVAKYTKIVNSPFLKIYPDIGNVAQWTDNPVYDIVANLDDSVQMHIKSTKPNTFRDLPWSQSTVPYQAILSALAQFNYHKDFVAEFWATDADCDEAQQLKSLQEAFSFVATHLEQAGFGLC